MTKPKKRIVKKKAVKKKAVKKKASKKKAAKKKIKKVIKKSLKAKEKGKKAKKSVSKSSKKTTKTKTKVSKSKKKVSKKVKKKVTKSAQRKTTSVKKIRTGSSFEKIEQKLLARRAELLKLITRSSTAEKDIAKLERGGVEDMAATSLEREMTFAIGSREREEFQMINNALKKIANKSYGMCENCGEKINVKRLIIVPFAQFCMECKSIAEQEMEVDREDPFSKRI